MAAILGQLQGIATGGAVDSELLAVIQLMTITMDGMKENHDAKR